MDFTQSIINYYDAETKQGFVFGLVSGIVITVLALAALIFVPSAILKGMATLLLTGGLIFLFGGFFAGRSAKRSKLPKVEFYKQDQKAFIAEEFGNVEKIHKAWIPIRIFWSLFLIAGSALLLLTPNPFLIGIAIGALIAGTLGHIEEVISYQHNEKYRKEIHREKLRLDQSTASLNYKF